MKIPKFISEMVNPFNLLLKGEKLILEGRIGVSKYVQLRNIMRKIV
jgi:hypothetical protein